MRRLAVFVTCIAVLGIGTAVWVSGASAGATVARKPAVPLSPSLRKQLSVGPRLTLRPRLPGSTACYVGLGSCSGHPCTEFVSPSSAVYEPVAPGIALASPLPSVRSQCRPAGRQLQRVGAAIAVAQPAPVSVRKTAAVQLVR